MSDVKWRSITEVALTSSSPLLYVHSGRKVETVLPFSARLDTKTHPPTHHLHFGRLSTRKEKTKQKTKQKPSLHKRIKANVLAATMAASLPW